MIELVNANPKKTWVKKLSGDSKARLEVAMMNGNAIQVDNLSIKYVLDYCVPAILSHIEPNSNELAQYVDDILEKALGRHVSEDAEKMVDKREVIAVTFNRVMDMSCITLILNDEDAPCKFEDLKNGTYAFCYVHNFTCEMFSEFGDCFFENFKRVG